MNFTQSIFANSKYLKKLKMAENLVKYFTKGKKEMSLNLTNIDWFRAFGVLEVYLICIIILDMIYIYIYIYIYTYMCVCVCVCVYIYIYIYIYICKYTG